MRRELEELRSRVVELENDAHEARQLNRRIAELADVMEELLLPLGLRDEERLAELLEKYRAGL